MNPLDVDVENSKANVENPNKELITKDKQSCKDVVHNNRLYQFMILFAIIVTVVLAITLPIVLINSNNDSSSNNNDDIIVNIDDYVDACTSVYSNCIYCVGNCNNDVTTITQPGAVLMGGGTDTDEAFEWHIKNANRGDFLVLRATGSDGYNSYIYNMSISIGYPLNSVSTIVTTSREASYNSTVLNLIRNAEAIFFGGGDQSLYLNYWVDTEVQSIIQSKLINTTVGGTSAGCAILGNWIFSAEQGTIISPEALSNPYNSKLTIANAFLNINYLETIITDTHFVTRDRMGRMNTFQARILKDIGIPHPIVSRAIGTDEHTALLLNVTTGDVLTVGVGTSYICSSYSNASRCEPMESPTFNNITCQRLSGIDKNTYSFHTWTGNGFNYTSNITKGCYEKSPYGSDLYNPILTYDDDTVIIPATTCEPVR